MCPIDNKINYLVDNFSYNYDLMAVLSDKNIKNSIYCNTHKDKKISFYCH
jgi:hypothetical protein